MDGVVTIKSQGKIIYQSNIWAMCLMIQHWGIGIQNDCFDQIFIDGVEIKKPVNMENDS